MGQLKPLVGTDYAAVGQVVPRVRALAEVAGTPGVPLGIAPTLGATPTRPEGTLPRNPSLLDLRKHWAQK